jgi:hypothetical protein
VVLAQLLREINKAKAPLILGMYFICYNLLFFIGHVQFHSVEYHSLRDF